VCRPLGHIAKLVSGNSSSVYSRSLLAYAPSGARDSWRSAFSQLL